MFRGSNPGGELPDDLFAGLDEATWQLVNTVPTTRRGLFAMILLADEIMREERADRSVSERPYRLLANLAAGVRTLDGRLIVAHRSVAVFLRVDSAVNKKGRRSGGGDRRPKSGRIPGSRPARGVQGFGISLLLSAIGLDRMCQKNGSAGQRHDSKH